MDSHKFSCEFCLHKSFSTKWNKKRHFMEVHNFHRKKARNFDNSIEAAKETVGNMEKSIKAAVETTANMEKSIEAAVETAANMEKSMAAVDTTVNKIPVEYEDLMIEDEDLLLHFDI